MAAIQIQVEGEVAYAIVKAKGGEKVYDAGLHDLAPIQDILKTIDVVGPHQNKWFGHAHTVTISSLQQLIAIARLNEADGIRLHVGYLAIGGEASDQDTIYIQFHHPNYAS